MIEFAPLSSIQTLSQPVLLNFFPNNCCQVANILIRKIICLLSLRKLEVFFSYLCGVMGYKLVKLHIFAAKLTCYFLHIFQRTSGQQNLTAQAAQAVHASPQQAY